jgi:hypothetical protein
VKKFRKTKPDSYILMKVRKGENVKKDEDTYIVTIEVR